MAQWLLQTGVLHELNSEDSRSSSSLERKFMHFKMIKYFTQQESEDMIDQQIINLETNEEFANRRWLHNFLAYLPPERFSIQDKVKC